MLTSVIPPGRRPTNKLHKSIISTHPESRAVKVVCFIKELSMFRQFKISSIYSSSMPDAAMGLMGFLDRVFNDLWQCHKKQG